MYDLIIIGAGAAGLFAAANSPANWKTLVLEKMDTPGKKLLLTGNGQCNLTNNEPVKAFLERYGENGKRLRPVLFPFSNIALMAFFERNGLPLKIRDDGKVFPASMKSQDVLNLLEKLGLKQGVEFRYQTDVTEIISMKNPQDSGYIAQTSKGEFRTKRILVATGGVSYPQTGSDGSFFSCLQRLGLKLVTRRPALVPVFVMDYLYKNLSGLTFSNSAIILTRTVGGRPIKIKGSLLFTHKGFSGPGILETSRYVTQGDKLTINYLPDKSSKNLRMELIEAASAGDSKQIVTVLESVTALPKSFLEFVCSIHNIPKNKKASHLTGQEMGVLASKITADSFEISGTGGYDIAMTTAGGVCLDEINLRTMEAIRFPGLYFAGEVLDVDGDTGGYNLQFAFSSAKCIYTKA